MRHVLAGVGALVALLTTTAVAQPEEPTQEQLKRLLARRLAEPWVKRGGWITDYDAAKEAAKQSDKRILAYFTRSFSPCLISERLERRVFSTEPFHALAREVVPFLHVTSEVEGRKDDGLFYRKVGGEFPRLLALDSDGGPLGVLYGDSVESLRAGLRKAEDFRLLLAKKDRTPAEELYVLRNEMALGRLAAADIRKRIAALRDLEEPVRRELDLRLLDQEITEALERLDGPGRGARHAACGELAGYWRAGREPRIDSHRYTTFFLLILEFAEGEGDVELFERGLGRLRAHLGGNSEWVGFLSDLERRLANLKAAGGVPPRK